MSLPWQQGSAHNILHGSSESAIPENPLVGAKISGLSVIRANLVMGDFVQILGRKFLALEDLNQKSKNNVL